MEVKEIIKILQSEYGYEFNREENKPQYEWLSKLIADVQKVVNLKLNIPAIINWVAFDFYKLETRPPKYGKYLITRKDGKIHWETWNGSGWAYNHNEIRYWAEIKPPCL